MLPATKRLARLFCLSLSVAASVLPTRLIDVKTAAAAPLDRVEAHRSPSGPWMVLDMVHYNIRKSSKSNAPENMKAKARIPITLPAV